MSERLEYFDVLRGLAIFCVVAIHASGTGVQFGYESLNFNFTILWRNALNFGVPMFLAISGFFLARRPMVGQSDYFRFLKSQIPRVYCPFFVWSLVWLVIAVVVYDRSFVGEFLKLAAFQSSAPYYFVALILQYYFLFPFLKRLSNVSGLAFGVILSVAAAVIIGVLRYFFGFDLPLVLYAGNFATWLMFFVLGLYLGSFGKIKMPNRYIMICALAFYVLSCAESYLLIYFFGRAGDAVTAVKVSSFMYSFFLIIFLFKNYGFIRSKLLRKVGVMSFGIYLTHMFFIVVVSKILLWLLPQLQDFAYAYQLLLTGFVLISCSLCISVCNKILPERQARLVGFK